jgi:hypothetical protein
MIVHILAFIAGACVGAILAAVLIVPSGADAHITECPHGDNPDDCPDCRH